MSWLNLNDSLNSLKGQISNFASNVLADEDQHTGKIHPYSYLNLGCHEKWHLIIITSIVHLLLLWSNYSELIELYVLVLVILFFPDASNINKDITELQKICTDQQEEVSVYIIHIIFIYLANGLFFQRSVLHHS